MIDLLFKGVGWTDIAFLLNRLAVGAFFLFSGYHKLFNAPRHRLFADELKALHVHALRINQWWVPLLTEPKPSGTGCVEYIGCCDSSPSQHASKHHAATGHPIITSFEPGEHWFYDYRTQDFFDGPKLRAPQSHPSDQPVPGPAGAVPSNWKTLLHE